MLQDQLGRKLHYLRLSLTDVCNFRCNYCLPDGYQCEERKHNLSIQEVRRLVNAFAVAGTRKIRLTGGEPSLRRDLPLIISLCKQQNGIEKVALTTNGHRLDERVESWKEAGLDALNVSVDSLDPSMFRLITGSDRLHGLLTGIEKALALGIKQVKVNTVLLNHLNSNQVSSYLDWVKDTPVTLRFIELMRTGDNREFFGRHHLSASFIQEQLETEGWRKINPLQDAGPAQEYCHPDFAGRIGLIMPYSSNFCADCNRLRVSSQGRLHLCLFGEHGSELRHLLQHDSLHELLVKEILKQVSHKQSHHYLGEGHSGSTRHLAELGG